MSATALAPGTTDADVSATSGIFGEIWFVTGTPGSGKSTVCRELAFAVPRGVHIPMDAMRWMVCGGYVSPRESPDGAREQLRLARRMAAMNADTYADAGYLVLLDDVVLHEDLPDLTAHLRHAPRKILLAPTLEEALHRNRTRPVPFDPALLIGPIQRLHPRFLSENTPARGWEVFDPTDEAPRRTALRVLAGSRESRR